MNRWTITLVMMCLLTLAGKLAYAQAQPTAGIQAYAEVVPTFDYQEKDAGGQKVGEAHLEAAEEI